MNHLLKYIDEIEKGNIIVGHELKEELANLKDDLSDKRYVYDTTDAKFRINFIENCVRLTKSPFYNKPMKLTLWEKAFIETIFSFKMADTGHRRFKKVVLLIARKNGKSELCSSLGLTEFFIGKGGQDIVCSSNDDNQASIIFDSINDMRSLIDPDEEDSHKNQRFLINLNNKTKIFKLSDRTRNKEGRNIDVAFLDESHEMKDNIIAKSIEQSQSIKDEPLFINITTEGFVIDGYLDEELKRCRSVIRGEDDGISAERLLPWLYTQDSEQEVFQNKKCWVKSNPSLYDGIKKWNYLDEQVDIARTSKADRRFVLSKDFNIKQNGVESWLNLEDYTYDATYNIEDFRGCVCIGAVDLSETTDLSCAKVLIQRPENRTMYVHTMYFIPESKLENSDDELAGAKYKEWAKDGLITITDGNDIDLSIVADWFYSLYTKYNIKLWKCGYDQRFAKDFLKRMEDYGWYKSNDDMIMILQNAQTLSNAIKLLEADFKHQFINYNQNDVDRWCLKNASIKVDNYGQCLIVKAENAKRIDGSVCFAILYETYRRYRTEWKQIIQENNK